MELLVNKNDEEKTLKDEEKTLKIGYIMPISDVDPYEDGHWEEVKNILDDAINNLKNDYEDYDIENFIVSEIRGVNSIILKSIVSNIYKCDLVICDVSSRNPNVMFELGMRLAFDKKIIIIKDDITDYSFDTSVINHIEYDKSLNYVSIKHFQRKLESHIKTTLDAPKGENDNAGYLDSFADVKIQTMGSHDLKEGEAIGQILEKLDRFGLSLSNLEKRVYSSRNSHKKSVYQSNPRKSEIIEESVKLREDELEFLADVILESILKDSKISIGELPSDVYTKRIISELKKMSPEYLNKNNILNIQDVMRKKIEDYQVDGN